MSNRTLNAQVGLQLRMLDRLAGDGEGTGTSARRRTGGLATTGAFGALLLAPVLAVAQAPGSNANDCSITRGGSGARGGNSTSATGSLTGLIETAANFLIIVGGALAILMFAIGGFMIMGLGGTKNAKKGFTVVKNALIGLAIMVSGLFIREVILNFIAGGTGGSAKTDCAKGLNLGQRGGN